MSEKNLNTHESTIIEVPTKWYDQKWFTTIMTAIGGSWAVERTTSLINDFSLNRMEGKLDSLDYEAIRKLPQERTIRELLDEGFAAKRNMPIIAAISSIPIAAALGYAIGKPSKQKIEISIDKKIPDSALTQVDAQGKIQETAVSKNIL